jgi:hypothetical protein
MEYVNKHGNRPVLSPCVFDPFGNGAAIDQNTFCSLSRMHNEFLHNVKHVEIHRLSDIDIELHLGIDNDDGEYYAKLIREIILGECDIDGQRIFQSIERTMKADAFHVIFSKYSEIMSPSILSDLDNWLSSKFVDTNNNIAFRKSAAVRVHTSTIDQRKSQTKVYASCISKRF